MTTKRLALAAVALLGGTPWTAHADIIYNHFGEPGDTFDTAPNSAWQQLGPSANPPLNRPVRIAMSFTVSGTTDFTFTHARLAMGLVSGSNQITLLRYANDTATGTPAFPPLDSIALSRALTSNPDGSVVTFTSTTHVRPSNRTIPEDT
jgi:hypothetical protein